MSDKSGISKVKGRGLAVGFIDFDEDGRQDIFVANDRTPNMLWHNNGDGTFTDVAVKAGCAYSNGGQLMGAMSVSIADYDHTGHESVFVTNVAGMPNTLFHNQGNGTFVDATNSLSGFGDFKPQFSFGADFLDYDADGWTDLIVANGLISDDPTVKVSGKSPAQPKRLYHHEPNGIFQIISGIKTLDAPMVSRGLAVGDFDNDGKVDFLVNNQNGQAQLFHNVGVSKNNWVSFKTIGTKSNRDGIHAKITIRYGPQVQTGVVRSGSSYMSVSDRQVYFGLGKAEIIDSVEIRWPSGKIDTMKNLAVDNRYQATETKGITVIDGVSK